MKKLLLVLLAFVLCATFAQGQHIMRSDSAKYVPATAWDSVFVGQGTMASTVWIGASHLSGNSQFAIAVENDTSFAGKKRLYVYPNNGIQWFPPVRAKYLRRKAVVGDSCVVQMFIVSQP